MLLTARQVLKRYGVTKEQLWQWQKEKKLTVHLTPRGKERYDSKEIETLLGRDSSRKEEAELPVAIYMRVARKKYLDYLERQRRYLKEYCYNHNYKIVLEVAEIASGLNEHRKGINKLLSAAKQGLIKRVIVENEERLARFGMFYLLKLFETYGVKVEVAENAANEDIKEEIADELVALVTFFSKKMKK